MKSISYYLGLATVVAVTAAFTACSTDDESFAKEQQSEQKQLTLTSTVAKVSAAKAPRRTINTDLQATQLANGQKVGAYVVQNETPTPTGNNTLLTADGNGGFTYATAMSWPASGAVSIYAYAPYNNSYSISAANAFSVAADQSTDEGYLASDLVYGVPTANNPISETNDGNVAMSFGHKLAKVVINIVNNESTVDVKGATVSIINTLPSTTINLTTGAIAEASGSATTIKTATFAATATEFKSAVIIVPQTVSAGTQLVKIEAGEKTFFAKVGADFTFVGGKQYNFTVNIGTPAVQTTLTLNGGEVANWDDATESLSDIAEEAVGPVVYGIGDYLLADGTLVKVSALGDQTPAAIIFSTTVSETDAAAGYGAYAMALKRYKNRTFVADADNPNMMSTGAGTWPEGLNDLDGRTHTADMLASDYYTARSAEEKAAFIANFTDFTPALSGTTNSGWYLPSFGQMIQIMNQFGEAGIVEATVTVPEGGIGSGSAFYTSPADALTTLVGKVQTNVTTADADLFAVGNIVYATSTENNSSSSAHKQKFWSVQCVAAGTYAFGKNTGRGTNGRSVIPVTAVKLPTE